jgi:type IV pilus assembly protein PilM
MNLLPKASGTRPRVACDISPQGVVAARSTLAGAPLSAVARVALAEGAIIPSLKPGNIADRVAVAAAVRKALESIGERPNSRGSDITLILPDQAVRVLLLEFDAFPGKLSEALPIVRFRLKKMLPFDADDAMVSFQVMSTSKTIVRVLAVAIPRDVLSEYETVTREAGFEPGAVLPSTLAGLAAVPSDDPTLVINANSLGITAAIVRSGILLLHRSVDLQDQPTGTPANLPPALFDTPDHAPAYLTGPTHSLPLVDLHDTAHEWAAQEPLPEHGRNPYADRVATETAVQDENSITGLRVPNIYADSTPPPRFDDAPAPGFYNDEPAPINNSPYASPLVDADLNAELHHAILVAPTSLGTLTDGRTEAYLPDIVSAALDRDPTPVNGATIPTSNLSSRPESPQSGDAAERRASGAATAPHPAALGEEIAQAVSVAVAYFEDTLATAPTRILSAGPLGADALGHILSGHGLAQADGLRVRELVSPESLQADAVSSSVPRGWLSAVVGALQG